MRKTIVLSGKQVDEAISAYLNISVDQLCEMNYYEDGYKVE